MTYFIAVVLPHKKFGRFLNTKVFSGITRAEYNQMVLLAAIGILLIFLAIFIKNTLKLSDRNSLWAYMALSVVLAAVVIKTLFVINIEMVHFPQYALFAVLCYPLLGSYQQALICTTLAGAMDEAYQYFYLAPKDTYYYDMNDVVTNLIGATLGLIFLRSFDVREWSFPRFFRSPAFIMLSAIAAVVALLCIAGVLSIYPSDDTPYQVIRKFPNAFWSHASFDVVYHVIRPLEGVLITTGLIVLYRWLGK